MKTIIIEWQGYVEEIREDSFTARLDEIFPDSSDGTQEEADFKISDLKPEEKPYLCLGIVFNWRIGYDENNKKCQELVFWKLPPLTEEQKQKAWDKAKGWVDNIKWD